MKLLLRRDQKSGMLGMGKITFTLDVRAQLSDEEKANIKKYKLADEILYERKENKEDERQSEIGKLGAVLAWRFLNLMITVKDLENGKQIAVKDIGEMLAAERQVKEAAQTFKFILEACTRFGGEEIIEFA